MIAFLIVIVLAFCLMELVSYAVHRFLYHKIFWKIHKSHHAPREGAFELNDVFPLFFACASIAVIMAGIAAGPWSLMFAVGLGVTGYGLVYFVVHDLYVHHRVKILSLRIRLFRALKRAHATHHRTGGEPYGLLFYPQFQNAHHTALPEEGTP